MHIDDFLQQYVQQAIASIYPEYIGQVEVVQGRPDHADYQVNLHALARTLPDRTPGALAAQIAQIIHDTHLGGFDEPNEVGVEVSCAAGFLNFKLQPKFIARALNTPQKVAPLKKRVVIDYSGPNVAKPIHVGYLRSTLIGDALARIARAVGYEVITDNHLGDWGTQFGIFIWGYKNNDKLKLPEGFAELDNEGRYAAIYKAACEAAKDPKVMNRCREEIVALQKGDRLSNEIWNRCVKTSRRALEAVYETLDIHFDHQLGESHYAHECPAVVGSLLDRGIARLCDGAAMVPMVKETDGDLPPAIVQKNDDAFNYLTTDIAAYLERARVFKADEIWYVVGVPQRVHFLQLAAVVRKMGFSSPIIKYIECGSVLDAQTGKMMRTREGESVPLNALIDETLERSYVRVCAVRETALDEPQKMEIAWAMGIGALKYAELSTNRTSDYAFDWERMLSFQGNTAPYLLNAYVRARGILARENVPDPALPTTVVASLGSVGELSTGEERHLGLLLARFPEALEAVLKDHRPHLLATYLHDLARAFHAFYEACPVLTEAHEVKISRLALCDLVACTLREGLGLLGIETVEKM